MFFVVGFLFSTFFLRPTRGLNQKSIHWTREFRSALASSATHKNAFKWYQAFRWNFSWEKNEPLATPISLGLSWPRKLFATIWELLAIAIYFHYGVCIIKHSTTKLHIDMKLCIQPGSLTARPWKMMVGILVSFWDGIFSGAMFNFQGVFENECGVRIWQYLVQTKQPVGTNIPH